MSRTTSQTSTTRETIHVTRRNQSSISNAVMRRVLRVLRPFVMPGLDTAPGPPGSLQLKPPNSEAKLCRVEEHRTEGIWHYRVSPLSATTGATIKCRVLYFAGGGFRMAPSDHHWRFVRVLSERLADKGIAIEIVSPALAPANTAETAIPALTAFIKAVLKEAGHSHQQVILAGDSAGGNLVSVLALQVVEEQEKKILTDVLAISPAVDMRNGNKDIWAVTKNDPLLNPEMTEKIAKDWTGPLERSDPRVSPLLADLTIFAKRDVRFHGVVGLYDVLAPDAVLFRKKLNSCGVEGEWLEWEKQIHCFPLAFSPLLKEAMAGFEWVVDLLERKCGA